MRFGPARSRPSFFMARLKALHLRQVGVRIAPPIARTQLHERRPSARSVRVRPVAPHDLRSRQRAPWRGPRRESEPSRQGGEGEGEEGEARHRSTADCPLWGEFVPVGVFGVRVGCPPLDTLPGAFLARPHCALASAHSLTHTHTHTHTHLSPFLQAKILVGFIQVVLSLSSNYRVRWPPAYQAFGDSISRFHIDPIPLFLPAVGLLPSPRADTRHGQPAFEFIFELAFDVMKQSKADTHIIALGPTDIPHTRRPRARPTPAGRKGSDSLGQTRYLALRMCENAERNESRPAPCSFLPIS